MSAKVITDISTTNLKRYQTASIEWDNFLGGGFVPSQVVLIGGEPGVGKSTLLIQLSTLIAQTGHKVLYASGEESMSQIKMRADRLGTLHPYIFCSESLQLEELYKTINEVDPRFIIIDSLQMVHSNKIKGSKGSASQMKACLESLIEHAKETNRVLIFIGQATKTGLIAGLITLQHAVDAVFFITKEEDGTRLVTCKKNRFASSQETFSLVMTEKGFTQFAKPIEERQGVKPKEIIVLSKGELLDHFKQNALTRFFVRNMLQRLETIFQSNRIEIVIHKSHGRI